MFTTCWSVKGGSGTTVVAAALASLAADGPGALLVDLVGDAPAVLGLPEPASPGLAGWMAEPHLPPDALARLEVPVAPGLALLPAGHPGATDAGPSPDASLGPARALLLAALLARDHRRVVVDAGVLHHRTLSAAGGLPLTLAAAASVSYLVLRPCYLALRRAAAAPLAPSAVVVVREPGRVLDAAEVAAVVGAPVRAVVDLDPAIARAVDAGTLATSLPRSLARQLRTAA